jgi:hypothetical protein
MNWKSLYLPIRNTVLAFVKAEENHEKPVRIACDPAGIRTEYRHNTSQTSEPGSVNSDGPKKAFTNYAG